MDSRFDNNIINDFTFNSSPVDTHSYQMDEFKLSIENPRFADPDFDYPNYSTFSLDSSFCQPISNFQTDQQQNDIVPSTPPKRGQRDNSKEKKVPLTPKPKKKSLIFQPFASFEATELTVQTLKKSLKKHSEPMTRAQSYGALGFDL